MQWAHGASASPAELKKALGVFDFRWCETETSVSKEERETLVRYLQTYGGDCYAVGTFKAVTRWFEPRDASEAGHYGHVLDRVRPARTGPTKR